VTGEPAGGKRLLFPHERVLQKLKRRKIAYVMVGVDGFNQWMPSSQQALATMDSDICVERSSENIERLLRILNEEGYVASLVTSSGRRGEAIDLRSSDDTRKAAARFTRGRLVIVAGHPSTGHSFDFIGRVSGYHFEDLDSDAVVFDRGIAPVRVARLEKILYSKLQANRRKDKEFFRRYASLIDEALLLSRPNKKNRRKTKTVKS
jgi:hypothetical protein